MAHPQIHLTRPKYYEFDAQRPVAGAHADRRICDLRFARLSRLAWATLDQTVVDIDPLHCSEHQD